ncbi:glutathione binding-like protein [Sandaracinobacteroides saxicola]|uniref:Glutathione S-transferase N-terminal domain-containing protein n=1 Tax=Sandaracinobacteroides saxicola TaxID=2759707 RepID=A0A7G5IJK1_9SPHN|nr:glutathione binding-like protein [Sandaracinobacteroides saxicola]QMW23543.1 glutathione S-transferase N-terminal domain-containing protein [Sandaracinobacteroides saxicola]
MRLYFAPMACSLAARIALNEAGIDADYTQVRLAERRTAEGEDYLAINPKAQVPALGLPDGRVVTEGPAVLQLIADAAPEAGLVPAAGTAARVEVQAWLNFLATEIHKGLFYPLFHPMAPEGARDFARETAMPKLAHLATREWLVERFSIADAYLLAILNWFEAGKLDIRDWPVLAAWRERVRQRPSVVAALRAELPLYQAA